MMQSITALAHLRAAVLYIVDISEQCGHTIQQQAALFHSIKPLFAGKPLMIVLNKIDATSMASLPQEDRAILQEMAVEALKTSSAGQAAIHRYLIEKQFEIKLIVYKAVLWGHRILPVHN